MIILAIETSCDDTCCALVEVRGKKNPRFKILSNIVSSQVEIHKKWGGVYPTLAKREHQKNLPIVLKKALRQAQDKQIDLIAVTVGPGLDPCLWVGVNFAIELAKNLKLPIVPVNHIEAHILANFIGNKSEICRGSTSTILKNQIFPAVCLVVSGGHTQLILMKDFGNYKILGETRDDAAGECFDKVARILGLGYPGGPAIAALAAKVNRDGFPVKLPRPMIYQKNYDFSFSGLKTAVLYDFKNRSAKVRKSPKESLPTPSLLASYGTGRLPTGQAKEYIRAMAAEVQKAIIDVLIYKALKAAKNWRAKSIILGGGVVANKELRKQFRKRIKTEIPNTKYLIPDTKYCTDNAAMIAATAYFHWLEGKTKDWTPHKEAASLSARVELPTRRPEIKANANLRIN